MRSSSSFFREIAPMYEPDMISVICFWPYGEFKYCDRYSGNIEGVVMRITWSEELATTFGVSAVNTADRNAPVLTPRAASNTSPF